MQNIECSFGCVARKAVLLKLNVANILLFNCCEQKFVQHGLITIAIECNGLSLLIFDEKWPNYASRLKSAANSDSFWVRRLFNVCVRVFCAPNATILLVYIPAILRHLLQYSLIVIRRLSKNHFLHCFNVSFSKKNGPIMRLNQNPH